jgi:hypothetical protein
MMLQGAAGTVMDGRFHSSFRAYGPGPFEVNLNNQGGLPAPKLVILDQDATQYKVTGGFKFADKAYSGHGTEGMEFRGEGSVSIEVSTNMADDSCRVAVKVAATGSYPSFELSGTGKFVDSGRTPATQLRTYTLDTPQGKARVTEHYFDEAPSRFKNWAVQWGFQPAGKEHVMLIFEAQ